MPHLIPRQRVSAQGDASGFAGAYLPAGRPASPAYRHDSVYRTFFLIPFVLTQKEEKSRLYYNNYLRIYKNKVQQGDLLLPSELPCFTKFS